MRERLKQLSTGVAIYGAGDAAFMIVNLCLLPIYAKANILTPADFAAIGIIMSIEAYAKILSRWGLDGAFMRFYHDRDEGPGRQRLTSTIVIFMLAANGVLLAAGESGAARLARLIALAPEYVTALRLMLLNMFLIAFTFVPFHVMRLRREAATFSAFTIARSAGQIVLRILFVIGLRWGVMGTYLADLVLTAVLLPLMWPWYRALLAPAFSSIELRHALRFGLPRLPHGLASQTLDGNPKLMLAQHVPEVELGVYQNGVTLGTGVAFFKNAFETAFAPFYYATAREADAREVFSKMATYGVAAFGLLVAGTTAVARDVILLVLTPAYLDAVPVVPIVALAFGLQGVYQLTSIGLNLTSRTEFYSVATITAAIVSVAAGAWLIPRYGVTGAAMTVLVSYATQTGIAFVLAQRVYPVRYETGRLLRVVAAGLLSALAGRWLVPMTVGPAIGLLARGTIAVVVFGAVLIVTGFFRATERAFVRELIGRARARR